MIERNFGLAPSEIVSASAPSKEANAATGLPLTVMMSGSPST
jgi:hypothetical protein